MIISRRDSPTMKSDGRPMLFFTHNSQSGGRHLFRRQGRTNLDCGTILLAGGL